MKPITVKELLSKLNEMPYLNDEERTLRELTTMQMKNVRLLYDHVGVLPVYGLHVFKNKKHGGYIIGRNDADDFHVLMAMSQRAHPYPVVPTQLKTYFQVSNVDVDKRHVELGIAKATYTFLATHTDIVSDHEQFLGATYLWKSLAKGTAVNVYVFDGSKHDYIRDVHGHIIKYNGKNIDAHQIWGSTEMYRTKLLVATTKNLK